MLWKKRRLPRLAAHDPKSCSSTRLRNPERAAIQTLATTGSALLGSALTTALGIGVLAVPPAMTVWGAYQNMRLRSMLQRHWDELDVAIEGIHRRHDAEQEPA